MNDFLNIKRKVASKHLFVFSVAVVFVAAVWCASLAAPGQALASVTGCSPSDIPMKVIGCEQVLCGHESSATLFFEGGISSPHYIDVAQSARDLSVGDVPFDAGARAALIGKNFEDMALIHAVQKLSTGLRNSVLNL